MESIQNKDSQSKISSNIEIATEIHQVLLKIKAENDGEFLSKIENEESHEAVIDTVPSSTRMCVFQLAESNDINRITSILDYLSVHKSSPESVSYMVSKYQLTPKLQKIFKKYCNGEYGFDHEASRNGKFQLALIQVTRNVLIDHASNNDKDKSQVPFFDFLANQTMDYIA